MRKATRQPVEIARRIVVDPRVRFGQPVIKGTRVPVSVLLDELAAGRHPRGHPLGPSQLVASGDRLDADLPRIPSPLSR